MSVSDVRRPGPESTLGDVRHRLVEAATTTLLERGVEIGLDQLKLSDIIDATGIPRATAYRSLAEEELGPQDALRRAVIYGLLVRNSREGTFRAVDDAVSCELERQREKLEGGVVERTSVMRAIIRVGSAASYRSVAASTERAILIAAYGALTSQGDSAAPWQIDALKFGEQEISQLFAKTYSDLSALFGYQLRPGCEMAHFSTAAAGMVEGFAMRARVSNNLDRLERPTGPGGACEDWTLFGVCFEAIYTTFFEPIDDEPFADLEQY